ncbi:P-II family nitrogen regulator [Facklamia miroungae]|uniref:Nitrogen regulatory protein P-II n=1 Tax=Facklamia miroungae TaxID=120956 RepID=A0A1G7TWX0_9LACT|nr:P-II family nitrogen regulator [Facklamia miroungae]NKZ30006.1 P-II family nitrogen regulator [Facklamia miroungae]SDG39752.1 Nitrogen regulatory protein P-II [Facklamia miroungae]
MQTVLFFAIVKKGTASYFLEQARLAGATGGTIFQAEGTIANPFLDLLGLNDSKREVLLMLVDYANEAKIHQVLTDKCELAKKGKGILFSVNTTSVYGSKQLKHEFNQGGQGVSKYQLLATIVDRDSGDEVVETARAEGAGGATIIHGRGLGSKKAPKIFNVQIEPEKELVLMIVESQKVPEIIEKVSHAMDIDQPGKGILFTVDVNEVSGLFQQIN